MTTPLTAAVAAYRLPTEHRLPEAPLEDAEFDALLGDGEHHRILGLLGTAVRDGAFPVSERQRNEVERRWQAWLAHGVRIERVVLEATEVLQAHRIRSRVLKGVALAHTVYGDPSQRVFGDIDLLVEPQHFTRAANVLIAELGAARSLPEIRHGFDDRFGKEILVRIHDLEFDLHRVFVEGPYGATMKLGDLWAAPEPFELAGRELLTLSTAGRTLHAAYAAALGDWPPRLNGLHDFAQACASESRALPEATALARRWDCEAVVGVALAHVHEVFGANVAGSASPRGEVSRRNRLFLQSYRGSGRGYLRNVVAPMAIPGFRNEVAFLAAVALPDRAYLTARGADRTSFVRNAWTKVRRGRRES